MDLLRRILLRRHRVLARLRDIAHAVEVLVAHRRAVGEDGLVLYTASLGDYSGPPRILRPDPSIDYVCVTDSDRELPSPWTPLRIRSDLRDRKLVTGYVKACPHDFFPSAAVSCWVDSSYKTIRITARSMLRMLDGADWSIRRHPERRSVAEEIAVVRTLAFDLPDRLDRAEALVAEYETSRDSLPLLFGSFLVRRHDRPEVVAAGRLWWMLILSLSRRDQIPLGIALRLAGVNWHAEVGRVGWRLEASHKYRYALREVRAEDYSSDGLPELAEGWPTS